MIPTASTAALYGGSIENLTHRASTPTRDRRHRIGSCCAASPKDTKTVECHGARIAPENAHIPGINGLVGTSMGQPYRWVRLGRLAAVSLGPGEPPTHSPRHLLAEGDARIDDRYAHTNVPRRDTKARSDGWVMGTSRRPLDGDCSHVS